MCRVCVNVRDLMFLAVYILAHYMFVVLRLWVNPIKVKVIILCLINKIIKKKNVQLWSIVKYIQLNKFQIIYFW